MNFKLLNNIAGWLVFALAATVFYNSIESTGSLWDCGEFVAGADKLQVVHPPGAPLFLLIGRLFVMIGKTFSGAPEAAALSVNFMSGICTAFGAMFICWVTSILGKMSLVGRSDEVSIGQGIAACGAGIVGGLSSAFITSNWFSAVEGEVYAMSTFFTCLTIWAIVKWYHLPNTAKADRWLIFAIYASALSIGVHLLSLLTFPALALFYYFKKYEKHTFLGVAGAGLAGIALVVGMQKLIVTGIPGLWGSLEKFLVNGIGVAPMMSSTVILLAILVASCYYAIKYATNKQNAILQNLAVAFTVSVIGYSVIGMVVIRANANTPINMNTPSDPLRLLPYLNREQYGDRPLFKGPNFNAEPVDQEVEERYGRVGNKYEVVSQKLEYVYDNKDKILFPRMGDYQPGREQQYRAWMDHKGNPTFSDNVSYFVNYQVGWMYWRYFMWNFVGRQNGEQGYLPADKTSGHWLSGIKSIDEARLYNQSELTEAMKNDPSRNVYYAIPLILGLIGLGYHMMKRPQEFLSLLGLFVITGIGIIVYTNQTPQEPRERDYVLVGSFFTFCVWIGLAVVAMFDVLSKRINGVAVAAAATVIGLASPYLLLTQNFDDHSRREHTGARDYAANFLNSVKPNAIIFTYGDNDTYPLWYAQEVEGIRTDVRVVNLSLIAVDWYIEQQRRKINDAAPIKFSISSDAYRGNRRDQTPVYGPSVGQVMDLRDALKYVGETHKMSGGRGVEFQSTLPTTEFTLPVDVEKMKANGLLNPSDTGVVNAINFSIGKDSKYIIKDDLAILDLIASNINDRPIYFAVTCQDEKLQGLEDWTQLEGLALRILPIKTPKAPQFRNLGILGAGRVDTKSVFENVTQKFKWGNFDTKKLYVDRSYGPSIQSHRFVILRTVLALIEEGKNKEAADLIDTYFKAFPNMNFRYDFNAFNLIAAYQQANAYDRAKPHVEILAKNLLENFKFYESIGDKVENGFVQDYRYSLQTMGDLIDLVKRAGDTNYAQQLEKEFEPYNILKDANKLAPLKQ
jgi:Protein of unknown function (DUF2723)